MKPGYVFILLTITILSCTLSSTAGTTPPTPITTSTSITAPSTEISSTKTLTATLTSTVFPMGTITATRLPSVESLKAKVTADLLSCRYGPGAEYLYLYALKAGANIKLIGRTDANNWVWVDGTNKCWVNAKFLDIAGDRLSLPVVYPGIAKLPISPYYPAPAWAKAIRKGDSVQVTWEAVPISPGKYEDANMHQYIVEVWRCENGQIVFETLGTNFPFITIEDDQAGCSVPSHGNVWVQEKHGFAGPTEIPWPPHPAP
jgi:uncharacterized protein YraI